MNVNSKTLITIPVFNGEQYISRTLLSCVEQTVITDILVIDNCSTDATPQIVNTFIASYPQIKLVINEENVGRVGNWNRCLQLFEESHHDYLKMVFVGDRLRTNCIERVDEIFSAEPGLAIVAWPYTFIDVKNNKQRVPRLLNEDIRLTKEQLVDRNMYPSQFAGAIICHTFSKFAVQGERFIDIFLGMAEFTNKVPLKGGFYHHNTSLSEFHLDGHSSYATQFDCLFVLERAFTKAISLERSKSWIDKDKYNEIKQKILQQLNESYK